MKFREDPYKPNITGICRKNNTIEVSETGFNCESDFTCPVLPAVVEGSAVLARPGHAFGPCLAKADFETACPGVRVFVQHLAVDADAMMATSKLHVKLTPSSDRIFANITFSQMLTLQSFQV